MVDYFNLISNLDEGFFAVDATNNFSPIIISNTFAGLYGFPVNDFYNNSNLWFEQIYPDDKKIVLDKMNALYKGIPTFEEHRIIRKDGSVMWVSGKVTPTLDENKKLVRLDGVISDITARKNAEEKLKEEEANLKSIIENTDANIYSIDRNFRYISFNSNLKNAVKNAFGVEIKKGDNTFSIYEKINPAEAKWWEEIYSSIFKRKEPASFVKDYSTENIPMFFHFSISPIWENKEVVGLSCFSRNITGKILSEKKIDELTQRLLLATNSAHIGIFDWDISSNKLTWDKNMYLLYGVSPDEKENPQVIASNKLHPDDLPILTIKVKEAMQTGFFHEEFRIIWSNGEIHYTEAHAIIQKDEKGNIRMIGVNCDITEQKLSEEKLKISEAQVRKLAQHLNNVLEEERARIAREIHDELGQQLAGIKMGLFSLKKNAGNIELTEKRINEIVSDAENAIRSMRKISTQLRPGILDTLGLVPSISWIAQEFEKKSGIKCDLKINSNEAPLNSETSICFYRICQEAFTNISKHSGASSVKVEVEQTEKVFSLKISDNGKGFDNSKLENPFSIGLLGMRERAKNINASLEIESQPNNGTSICAVLILNQIK